AGRARTRPTRGWHPRDFQRPPTIFCLTFPANMFSSFILRAFIMFRTGESAGHRPRERPVRSPGVCGGLRPSQTGDYRAQSNWTLGRPYEVAPVFLRVHPAALSLAANAGVDFGGQLDRLPQ